VNFGKLFLNVGLKGMPLFGIPGSFLFSFVLSSVLISACFVFCPALNVLGTLNCHLNTQTSL